MISPTQMTTKHLLYSIDRISGVSHFVMFDLSRTSEEYPMVSTTVELQIDHADEVGTSWRSTRATVYSINNWIIMDIVQDGGGSWQRKIVIQLYNEQGSYRNDCLCTIYVELFFTDIATLRTFLK